MEHLLYGGMDFHQTCQLNKLHTRRPIFICFPLNELKTLAIAILTRLMLSLSTKCYFHLELPSLGKRVGNSEVKPERNFKSM